MPPRPKSWDLEADLSSSFALPHPTTKHPAGTRKFRIVGRTLPTPHHMEKPRGWGRPCVFHLFELCLLAPSRGRVAACPMVSSVLARGQDLYPRCLLTCEEGRMRAQGPPSHPPGLSRSPAQGRAKDSACWRLRELPRGQKEYDPGSNGVNAFYRPRRIKFPCHACTRRGPGAKRRCGSRIARTGACACVTAGGSQSARCGPHDACARPRPGP